VSAKVFVDAILAICCGCKVAEEAADLAMSSFLCCHYPLVSSVDPHLWLKLLRFGSLEPSKFIESHASSLRALAVDDFKNVPCFSNALKTLLAAGSARILPTVVRNCVNKLTNSELLSVSQTDYAIYLTPEGELFDKSVVAADSNEGILNAKNMKRESKAYSYKEQVG